MANLAAALDKTPTQGGAWRLAPGVRRRGLARLSRPRSQPWPSEGKRLTQISVSGSVPRVFATQGRFSVSGSVPRVSSQVLSQGFRLRFCPKGFVSGSGQIFTRSPRQELAGAPRDDEFPAGPKRVPDRARAAVGLCAQHIDIVGDCHYPVPDGDSGHEPHGFAPGWRKKGPKTLQSANKTGTGVCLCAPRWTISLRSASRACALRAS
jgi:hypothetical protein